MSHSPLVSCIMPTCNRRRFVPFAIHYFLTQDYPNKELIILDDGDDPVEDLVPDNTLIRYIRIEKKLTLGRKLNMGCNLAEGEMIAHWDDDDWYAAGRITSQVECLEQTGRRLCGINDLLYHNLVSQESFNYKYPAHLRTWLSGSSLFYKKGLWENNKFADINVGMDGLFTWNTPPEDICVMADNTYSVLFIHPNNVSPKKTANPWWLTIETDRIKNILGKDWIHYEAWQAENA
jgi:glycosyltransferase involved in cell wall biosynthesis